MLVGKSHIWHEFSSLPYTGVLGFIVSIVCFKPLRIGPCESSWDYLKKIKTGKRSHLGGELKNGRSVLYTTANIHDARININIMEKIDSEVPNTMFGDDDIK